MGLGGACLTLVQAAIGVLRGRVDAATYQDAAPDPLFAGLVAAALVGAGFGWHRSRPIDNIWQRGVIAVLAAVGALLVGFLAAPVDHFFGIPGMLVWLAAGIAGGVAGSRWATKGSGERVAGSGS